MDRVAFPSTLCIRKSKQARLRITPRPSTIAWKVSLNEISKFSDYFLFING